MKPVTPLDHHNTDISRAMNQGSVLIGNLKSGHSGATVTQLPVSPGQKLQQAREKIGLQRTDIASILHLPERYVRALELDDFDVLPGVTFARGYIRLYAREVRLSAGDLVAAFDEMILNMAEPEVVDSLSLLKKKPQWRDSPISWISYLIVGVVMALAISWWWDADSVGGRALEGSDEKLVTEALSNERLAFTISKKNSESVHKEKTGITPNFSVIEKLIGTTTTAPKASESEGVLLATIVTDQSQVPTREESQKVVSDMSAESIQAPEPLVEDSIFMSFTGECWVRVADENDKTIHVSLRREGDVLRIKGVAPFHVKLGDAKVVALKFNDRTISVPDPVGQSNVVKFVISSESA
ncbi:MAG: DUF4115 domain-containing protein [Pseudomonadales bacterium]|nr:DUF4115 domain-containing protein [Pseudomonadales bacterium]